MTLCNRDFYYLMYMFYRQNNNTMADKYWVKYCEILDNGGALADLIQKGYITKMRKGWDTRWSLSEKGIQYIFTHLPFSELWALYRDGAISW